MHARYNLRNADSISPVIPVVGIIVGVVWVLIWIAIGIIGICLVRAIFPMAAIFPVVITPAPPLMLATCGR